MSCVLRFDPATGTWVDLSSTILSLPELVVAHSSPSVSVPGEGLYSLNGMAWEESSQRTQQLSDGTLNVTIVSLAPGYGPTSGGTSVTITGTNFYGVTRVTFDGIPAAGFTVESSTHITATTPAHAAGTVRVQVITTEGETADTPADDFVYQVTYTSLRGADRYDTAIKISRAAFPTALPPGSGLVLAPGETYQEALCGAPLAAAYGGPVLLTPTVGLNNAVRDEILRLQPAHVVLIGLSDAVKNAVRDALGSSGSVSVIRGSSVHDMSYRVAKALGARVGSLSAATAIVTRGDKFPDAIAISPLACHERWPVLLTGSTDVLSISAVQAMGELGIKAAIKVGTYVTLPPNVTGRANLSGADRYHTCANVADWAKANAGLSYAHAGITTGDKFPDALAAGPYLAKDHGVVLLSPLYGPLPAPIASVLAANATDVYHVTFFAMIEPVIGQVKGLLQQGI
jgi:putative cell wall-binding protein